MLKLILLMTVLAVPGTADPSLSGFKGFMDTAGHTAKCDGGGDILAELDVSLLECAAACKANSTCRAFEFEDDSKPARFDPETNTTRPARIRYNCELLPDTNETTHMQPVDIDQGFCFTSCSTDCAARGSACDRCDGTVPGFRRMVHAAGVTTKCQGGGRQIGNDLNLTLDECAAVCQDIYNCTGFEWDDDSRPAFVYDNYEYPAKIMYDCELYTDDDPTKPLQPRPPPPKHDGYCFITCDASCARESGDYVCGECGKIPGATTPPTEATTPPTTPPTAGINTPTEATTPPTEATTPPTEATTPPTTADDVNGCTLTATTSVAAACFGVFLYVLG